MVRCGTVVAEVLTAKGYHNMAPWVGDGLEVRLSLQPILRVQKLRQELKQRGEDVLDALERLGTGG